jgi:hypothetical protein
MKHSAPCFNLFLKSEGWKMQNECATQKASENKQMHLKGATGSYASETLDGSILYQLPNGKTIMPRAYTPD